MASESGDCEGVDADTVRVILRTDAEDPAEIRCEITLHVPDEE